MLKTSSYLVAQKKLHHNLDSSLKPSVKYFPLIFCNVLKKKSHKWIIPRKFLKSEHRREFNSEFEKVLDIFQYGILKGGQSLFLIFWVLGGGGRWVGWGGGVGKHTESGYSFNLYFYNSIHVYLRCEDTEQQTKTLKRSCCSLLKADYYSYSINKFWFSLESFFFSPDFRVEPIHIKYQTHIM